MIIKHIKRMRYALMGLWHASTKDIAFAIQLYGGAIVVGLVAYFFHPLSSTEMLFVGLAWALVLITEMQNTSFETALDRLHPDHHADIGKSKDMAAASVLLAGCFALFVVISVALF